MLNLLKITRLDEDTVRRIGDVLLIATKNNDFGVVDWAARAVDDASHLGKLRQKDIDALERLERTYSSDFYRNSREREASAHTRYQAA